ncbi:MAG: hypothetical protein ACRBN8_33900 [Nannocystales bacterium]
MLSLSHTFFQEVVPLVLVLLAGTWLVRRWMRTGSTADSGCAGCEQARAQPARVRHRLPVLSSRAPKFR